MNKENYGIEFEIVKSEEEFKLYISLYVLSKKFLIFNHKEILDKFFVCKGDYESVEHGIKVIEENKEFVLFFLVNNKFYKDYSIIYKETDKNIFFVYACFIESDINNNIRIMLKSIGKYNEYEKIVNLESIGINKLIKYDMYNYNEYINFDDESEEILDIHYNENLEKAKGIKKIKEKYYKRIDLKDEIQILYRWKCRKYDKLFDIKKDLLNIFIPIKYICIRYNSMACIESWEKYILSKYNNSMKIIIDDICNDENIYSKRISILLTDDISINLVPSDSIMYDYRKCIIYINNIYPILIDKTNIIFRVSIDPEDRDHLIIKLCENNK